MDVGLPTGGTPSPGSATKPPLVSAAIHNYEVRGSAAVAAAEQLDEPVLLESDETEPWEQGDECRAGSEDRLAPDPLFHWVYLGMALGVVLLAFVLRLRGEQQVLLPGFDQPLPDVCTFKRYLGIGCPGCGLTRSLISLADGDLSRAWHFNPLGLGVAALFVFQIPYRLLQLWRLRRGLPEWNACRLGSWALLVLAIGLFVQWIVRLVSVSA